MTVSITHLRRRHPNRRQDALPAVPAARNPARRDQELAITALFSPWLTPAETRSVIEMSAARSRMISAGVAAILEASSP